MGYYLSFRQPGGYSRVKIHFDALDDAKAYVLKFITDHKNFYKTCKSLDSGCFDIRPDFEYGKDSKIYRYIATEDHYKKPEYVEIDEKVEFSFIYRGVAVNIYEDDYGQCYYFRCIINGELIENSCGGWNPDYMTETTSAIDYILDRK